MNDKKLFFTSLILLIALITFDTIAKVTSFYYFYPNADILMHFIGGFSLVTLSIVLLRHMKMSSKANVFIIILFLSLFWEYVEFRIGKNILINKSFIVDTCVDLLMNALGGIIAYICFYKNRHELRNPHHHQKNSQN